MTYETIVTPELIEEYTSQGYWVNRVITDYLDEYADAMPDKVAFVDARGETTYAELKRQVDQAARGLLELFLAHVEQWEHAHIGDDGIDAHVAAPPQRISARSPTRGSHARRRPSPDPDTWLRSRWPVRFPST